LHSFPTRRSSDLPCSRSHRPGAWDNTGVPLCPSASSRGADQGIWGDRPWGGWGRNLIEQTLYGSEVVFELIHTLCPDSEERLMPAHGAFQREAELRLGAGL